jgi:hypothetical protein
MPIEVTTASFRIPRELPVNYLTQIRPEGIVTDVWPAAPGQDRLLLTVNVNGVRLSSRATLCVLACLGELVTDQLPVVRLVVTVESECEPSAATLAAWVAGWLRATGVA